MTFTPRAWQVRAREAFEQFDHSTGKGAMVVAATGAGKTALGHYILQPVIESGGRVLWVANRDELVTQPLKTLRKWWPRYTGGIVKASRNQVSTQVVYASKDTIYNGARAEPFERLQAILEHGMPSVVVVDEAHYSASKTWQAIIHYIRAVSPTTRFLGLTATPDRSDNKRLSDTWEVVFSYPIVQAIDDGVLVPPFAAIDLVPEMDLSAVGMIGQDYDQGALEKELLDKHIIPHTVDALFKEHVFHRLPFRDEQLVAVPGTDGVVVFTVTVKQAKLTAAAMNARGIKTEAVWGEMPRTARARALSAYEKGELNALVNADLLTVGWDSPRTRVGVLAKTTQAWARFVQILGRMLRTSPGKLRALLVDLCGSTDRLSLVSAPVLVDGIDCPESDDHRHRFIPIEGTSEGVCTSCGLTIKCFANRGGHKFKDHKCKYCKAPQCSEADDLAHHWVPWEEGKRICIHCGTEIPDRLCSLVKRVEFEKAPVAWKKLATPGTVYAVHVGTGVLYNVKLGDGWQPYFLARGRLSPLSPRPTTPEMSRMLTDDVASRSQKRKGFFGAQTSSRKMREACKTAEREATRLKIWDPTRS